MIEYNVIIAKEKDSLLYFEYKHLENLWTGKGVFSLDPENFFGQSIILTKIEEDDKLLKDAILEINRNTILKLNTSLNFLDDPKTYPKKGYIKEIDGGFKQILANKEFCHELIYKKPPLKSPTFFVDTENYNTLLSFEYRTKNLKKGDLGTTYVYSIPISKDNLL